MQRSQGTLSFRERHPPALRRGACKNPSPHQGSFVDGNFLLPDEAVLEVLLFTMEHGPPLGIHLNAGKAELLMGKHGSYDAAYSFFEELTNPEGPYRLQPERVRFHPDD